MVGVTEESELAEWDGRKGRIEGRKLLSSFYFSILLLLLLYLYKSKNIFFFPSSSSSSSLSLSLSLYFYSAIFTGPCKKKKKKWQNISLVACDIPT